MVYAICRYVIAGLLVLSCGCGPGGELNVKKIDVAAPQKLHTLYGSFNLTDGTLPNLQDVAPAPVDSEGAPSRHIVQFRSTIKGGQRQSLIDRGIEILGYMPQNALVVLATVPQLAWLREQAFVQVVIPQPTLLKLHPSLVEASRSGLFSVGTSGDQTYVVELTDASHRTAVTGIVLALHGEVATGRQHSRILRVRLDRQGLTALLSVPQVSSIEPFHRQRLFNDRSYGIVQSARPHRATVWNHGLWGAGQLIGISDTGVDVNSCFFSAGKVAAYIDYAGIDDHDGSGKGHGTHAAGSIAGDRLGNGIYDLHDGMAPAAHLVVQDVGNGDDLIGIPDDLGELFADAYAQGVRIHSNSWGGGDNSYDAVARSVDAFVFLHPDFLPLFANGNDGLKGDGSVSSPATAKNVVSVAAIDATQPGILADFSSRGPTADLRIKPTIVAPGVDVLSAQRGAACEVVSMSGTSMATPTAAGAAALAREYFVRGFYPSGKARSEDALLPSAALLRAVLIAGADDLSGGTWGSFPGRGQGFGRLQLDNALGFADSGPRLFVAEERQGLSSGMTKKFVVTHDGHGPLKFTLAWTDQPGMPGAKKALVNDLDLIVTGPDGAVYHGNVIAMGASVSLVPTAKQFDQRNVEEVVTLPRPKPGAYTVTVRGSNVPLGPQSFALVALGAFRGPGRALPPAAAIPAPGKAVPGLVKGTPKRSHMKKDES